MATSSSVIPEKFDSGDITSWLRLFECCAAANSWNDEKKLTYLPAFLRGPAATYYHSLAATQKDTYEHLTKNLRLVLCTPVDREKFFQDFEQRVLRPQEDPSLFLWNLKENLSKADPELTDDARNALLSRQFMKGLPSSLRLRLLEHNPTHSLTEMTEFVQRFRAIHHSEEATALTFSAYAEPPTVSPPQADLQSCLAQLTAAVTTLSSDQKDLRAAMERPAPRVQAGPVHQNLDFCPPRGSPNSQWSNGRRRQNQNTRCFNCNQPGHFARSCPWNSQCQLCSGWGHTQMQCANNHLGNQASSNSLNFNGVPQ